MYKKLIYIIGILLVLVGCEEKNIQGKNDDESWGLPFISEGKLIFNQHEDSITPPAEEEWGLHSQNIVLIDLTDDEILYAKNENQKTYPASLTKIMTVLVALENMIEETMVTTSDYTELYEEGASLAGFFPNDRVNSMDLLYGTMLPSGAEAALSLAENIAGSEKEFVRLMNKKVQELGMEETHFENVTGLHEPNHYTTVNDLSILLKEALKNPTFKEIFTTDRYSTHRSSKNIDGITFESRLISKLDSKTFKGGKFLGGKTGYTHEAGLCLASLATDGDKEYILITTGAEGNAYTEPFNILDAINLYERFFNQKA